MNLSKAELSSGRGMMPLASALNTSLLIVAYLRREAKSLVKKVHFAHELFDKLLVKPVSQSKLFSVLVSG